MKMRLTCFIMFLYATMCLGCRTGQKKDSTVKTDIQKKDCMDIKIDITELQKEEILSWDYEQAIVELGEPVSRDMFSITEVSKFSIELLNFFPRNSDVQIKELTFETDSIMNLTIWYTEKDEKWKPIHFMKWDKNSQL